MSIHSTYVPATFMSHLNAKVGVAVFPTQCGYTTSKLLTTALLEMVTSF